MYVYTYVYIYIYGFLVCRYARSPGLAARQNTPAFDAATYRPNSTSYQLQPSFHPQSTEPEPTARAVLICIYVGSRRACGVGDCACLVPTLGELGETSGPRYDRIPPTRPPWWGRHIAN